MKIVWQKKHPERLLYSHNHFENEFLIKKVWYNRCQVGKKIDVGGYEAAPASGVTAEAEAVLMASIKNLLQR